MSNVPGYLSASAVNHDYDRARTTVKFGIAADLPRDPRAVLIGHLSSVE
jgi:hypothetical protein